MKRDLFIFLVIIVLFGLFIWVATERAEQIDNGQVTVVSESNMN